MPHETFTYIYAPKHDHNPNDVLENTYKSLDVIRTRFVVHAHGIGYQVYASAAEFTTRLATLPASERIFHEVIFGGPQKLKFDIDAMPAAVAALNDVHVEQPDPATDCPEPDVDLMELLMSCITPAQCPDTTVAQTPDTLGDKYRIVLHTILQAITEAFFVCYGFDVAPENIIVCESRGVGPITKYSNHIVIAGYYVTTNIQAAEFTRKVVSYLPADYRQFIDMSVNKSLQEFRIAGCHKNDSDRVKYIIGDAPIPQTFISCTDQCAVLPDIIAHVARPVQVLCSDDIQIVQDICASDPEIAAAHTYCTSDKGALLYNRVRPSMCEFCNRVHETDNTILVTTCTNNGITSVYKKCRKFLRECPADCNVPRSVKIGEYLSDPAAVIRASVLDTPSSAELCSRADSFLRAVVEKPVMTPLPRLPPGCTRTEYDEPSLRDFELVPTLVVHAPMKIGKTKKLAEHIATHFTSALRPPIIRFVSFRQTFSNNIKERFPDFVLYNDVKGDLVAPRLIVQVESLHRLRCGTEAPDLLILDECESILDQFGSGLMHGNFTDCFAKFQYLLRYSKHVVCMDAGISERTWAVLAQMRPGPVHYHHNMLQNAVDDVYSVTADPAKWLAALYESLDNDMRVAIPMNSLTEAKALAKSVADRYPALRVKLYSSETLQSEKREHFGNVDAYWAQYDVLIYTPTVSAGVSFETKHYHKVFGYFTDMSCGVETCVQMIGRIRDVASREYIMYISGSPNNLPTTTEAVHRMLHDRRSNLQRDFDDTGLRFEYDAAGQVTLHNTDYLTLWTENMKVRNRNTNSFVRRFIGAIVTTGASVQWLQSCDLVLTPAEAAAALAMQRDNKRIVKAEKAAEIADANEISAAEYGEIQDKMTSQQDVPADQCFQYEKHKLRKTYDYTGPIDARFVTTYADPGAKQIYKNMTRYYTAQHEVSSAAISMRAPLVRIKSEESSIHSYLMSLGADFHNADLNRRYVHDRHRYALAYIQLCGWQSIVDPAYMHLTTILRNVNCEIYWQTIVSACIEFRVRSPSKTVASTLGETPALQWKYISTPIGKIIWEMYGLKIVSARNDPTMLHLHQCGLFTLSADVAAAKNMPLINTCDTKHAMAAADPQTSICTADAGQPDPLSWLNDLF